MIRATNGGNDTGAEGQNGLHESDVNLSVCEFLVVALEKLDLETILTRDSDVFVELEERCDVANQWEADYFVSVHCNSNGPTAVGIETLYVSQAGEALAKPIQEMLIEATGDVDRGLKYRSDLFVLNGTNCPSTLVECGFISNPETESWLRTAEYQKTVADAIAAGIAKYLNIAPSKLPKM